ncbi:MAG: hypothetical protein GW856_01445 [Cyanobacteria bacterium]|nr:hypothetical protein [Cyanobacteria bacterium CG_2015-16_32_12]
MFSHLSQDSVTFLYMFLGDGWQVAGGRWQVAGGRWQVAGDRWQDRY